MAPALMEWWRRRSRMVSATASNQAPTAMPKARPCNPSRSTVAMEMTTFRPTEMMATVTGVTVFLPL